MLETVLDFRLQVIQLHGSLHGGLSEKGTVTDTIEAKLAQQLANIKQETIYMIFSCHRKAYDTMDRRQCLVILRASGRAKQSATVWFFLEDAELVCQASGRHGPLSKYAKT